MAEAPYHGKACNAFWGDSAISQITGWVCNLRCPTADSTSRADTYHGRTRMSGAVGGTATVTAKLFGDFMPIAGSAARTLELLRDTTNASLGYEGTATCTAANASHNKDGIAEMTYEFAWSSTITTTITKGSG